MTEKEVLLERLKSLNAIGIQAVLNKYNMNRSGLYTGNYSLEKIQLVYDTLTDDLIKELKKQGKI